MPSPLNAILPWSEEEDLARRRLQQKGDLYKQGGWWKLRWMQDVSDASGQRIRRWSKPAYIGPCEGQGKLTQKEARRLAWDNFLSKLDQNSRTPMSVATIQQFIDRKFRPDVINLLKPAGRLHYEMMLQLVLPSIGSSQLCNFTPDDAQRVCSGVLAKTWRRKRKAEDGTSEEYGPRIPYSVQTATHVRNCLSAVFRHAKAVQWYADENPARFVKLPEMSRKEAHALSFTQLQQVLAASAYPVREMILLSVLTSMNVAEMCGLKWKRVNLSDEWCTVDGESLPPRTLVVREQFYLHQFGSVKKPSRKRPLPIPEALRLILLDLKRRPRWTGPDDVVFASRTGTPVDAHNLSNRDLKRIGKQLDMPWLSWHCFRRTHTTLADELDMDLSDRQAMLGHADPRMTVHYTKQSLDRRRGVLEQMAERVMADKQGTIQ